MSLQSLRPPVVASDSGLFAETACRTAFVPYVVCASAATPTHDVDSLALALTHRWSSFTHLTHLGGGEIRTTLSPRTIISPSFFWSSTTVVSSVSSRTRFKC